MRAAGEGPHEGHSGWLPISCGTSACLPALPPTHPTPPPCSTLQERLDVFIDSAAIPPALIYGIVQVCVCGGGAGLPFHLPAPLPARL